MNELIKKYTNRMLVLMGLKEDNEVHFTIKGTQQLRNNLDKLRDKTKSEDYTELMVKAFALLDYITTEKIDGKVFYTGNKDGVKEEVSI